MQVTKLRIASDNGLIPAGRYFHRLTEALRKAHENAAAVVDIYEQQERKVEARHRRNTASPVSTPRRRRMQTALH